MLQFGAKAPFSHSDFIERCESELYQDDMDIIKGESIEPAVEIEGRLPLLRDWRIFERGIRNELARTRAVKKGKDPNKYLRHSSSIDPFIAPLAHWAINQDSPMETELYLDRIRWEKIEELKFGHYFDIEYLAAYCLQLQILERWDRINSGAGMEVLEGLVKNI